MKTIAPLVAFAVAIFSITSSKTQAQCPGCQVNVFMCDTLGADGQICADSLPDGNAGLNYEQEITFKFPRRFTLRQGDPIPGTGLTYPALPQLPQVIVMDILNAKLDSISGLPLGLQWESDSSEYTPGISHQHGCLKICGHVDCSEAGSSPLVFHFTYTIDGQDFLDAINGSPVPIPVPTQLPLPTVYNVGFEINSGISGALAITTNKPTVISAGESITLSASPGFQHYSWSTGDTTSSITVTPDESAFITVQVSDDNSCSRVETIGITVLQTSGIEENIFGELKIYPNPNNGEFDMETPVHGDVQISVMDVQGKVLYAELLPGSSFGASKKVSLPPLEKGVYLIMLTDGQQKVFQKLIIH